MSLFNIFTRRRGAPEVVEQKASAVGALISAWKSDQAVWSSRDYEAMAREGYRENAIAFRCIKMIATGIASTRLMAVNRSGAEVENHPVMDLLARPNPMMSGAEFIEAVVAYLMISGNSYVEAVGPSDIRPPKELWALRPDRMKVIAGDSGMPKGYEYEHAGRKLRWSVDVIRGRSPILHMKEFNPTSDWYGMGRMEAAAFGVDRHNMAGEHNMALLQNGARPTGALVFEPVQEAAGGPFESAPEEVIKKAREKLTEQNVGPKNAGRPLVFGGKIRWEEMGLSPKDMDFAVSRLDAARDICTAYGVPHVLLIPGASTYNNVREAKLELWEDTILPVFDLVLSGFNAWLGPRFDGIQLAPDLDSISALEPRREAKRSSVALLLEKGVLDADEARFELQYGPRPAEAVKKVDASVLTALVNTVKLTGPQPLLRYMRSVGLVEPGMSDEEILAQAMDLIAVEDELEDDAEEADTPLDDNEEDEQYDE
jgi:HK97 family phage portal protein